MILVRATITVHAAPNLSDDEADEIAEEVSTLIDGATEAVRNAARERWGDRLTIDLDD